MVRMSDNSVKRFYVWMVGMLVILVITVLGFYEVITFTRTMFVISCIWALGGYIFNMAISYFEPHQYNWK